MHSMCLNKDSRRSRRSIFAIIVSRSAKIFILSKNIRAINNYKSEKYNMYLDNFFTRYFEHF